MTTHSSLLNSRGGSATLFVVTLVSLLTFMTIYTSIREAESQPEQLKPSNSVDFLESLVGTLDPDERCNDPEDPPSWRRDSCVCTDPVEPVRRNADQRKVWMDHHDTLRSLARDVPGELDVLILGDKLTEQWMGTKNMGVDPVPEFREVFAQSFVKHEHEHAHLNGVAMGCSGDTSPELLWHLQHGMLPQNVQPRAILIMIGSDDLHKAKCSKKNTLAGILNVASWLHEQRPNALIILHGLLPQGENNSDQLGVKWKEIEWVNHNVEQYTTVHDKWYYLDNSSLFLRNDNPDMVDGTLMENGVHPTLKAYELWTPALAKQISAIFAEQKAARHLR